MSDATRAFPESVSALPPGTRLAEFEIKRLLGIGGFGIVYLAFDHALEREVAIKEYMPASMAGRTETMHVSIRSQSDAEVFELGRRSFVNEAKLLARFDHPSLIKVHRFWEANGTAYMAMPVLRGRTMKDIRKSTQRAPDEAWLRTTMVPLLGALEVLHREGVFHRDIAPDNITIEPDGHPVLLDFGAARRVISDKTQTLTAILKPAYAPIEQYAEAGSVKQGPWTDLYALGATLHFMLLGHPPAPATARAVSDDSASLGGQALPGCTPGFLGVIDWMLAPRPNERPQSVADLRAVLEGHAPLPARGVPAAAATSVAAPWEKTVMAAAPAARDAGARAGVDLGLTRHAGTSPMRTANDDATRALPQTLAQAEHAGLAAEQGHALRPPAARSKLLPLALVGLALVAVAGYAGFAFRSSSTAPSATSAAAATVASPAPAPAPAPASLPAPVTAAPVAPAPAAPVATAESPPPAAAAPVAPPAHAAAATATTTATPARATRPPAALPHTAGGGATPATPGGAEHAGSRTTTSTTSTTPGAAATPTNQSGASPSAQGAGNTAGAGGAAMTQPATGAGAVPAGQSPAAAVAASSSLPGPGATPDARCGGRNPLSYFVCMERECLRSAFRNHPECEKWRTQARQREGN